MQSRRTVLAGVGGLLTTTALAGCSGDDAQSEDTDDVGDPEEVVREYFELLLDGDVEAVNERLHADSGLYPIGEDDVPEDDGSVASVEELTLEEHEEWRNENTGPTGNVPEDIREEMLSELGASEVVHILVTSSIEEEEQQVVVYAGLFDNEWLVYFP